MTGLFAWISLDHFVSDLFYESSRHQKLIVISSSVSSKRHPVDNIDVIIQFLCTLDMYRVDNKYGIFSGNAFNYTQT